MESMDKILAAPRDAFNVGRVFGEPVEKGELTVIPVAIISGGGGGGEGNGPTGDDPESTTPGGSGAGFGGMARPAGVYVVRGDSVEWQPAVNVTLLALGGIALGALITVVVGGILKRILG
jgi:uncharacterized spore protein YtfJ